MSPVAASEPDPEGRIRRDPGEFVRVESTTVPVRIRPSATVRVHLEFRPAESKDAHWNNEVGGLVVWFDPPPGWEVDRQHSEVGPPALPVSEEVRRVEFEIRSPPDAEGPLRLPGYALYYVCEGVKGQCLYRRQDLSVELGVQR